MEEPIDREHVDRFGRLNSIIDSIPNEDTDLEFSSDEDYESDDTDELKLSPQEQWEESLKQINSLVSFVIFPLIGKILGRRFSHTLWRLYDLMYE
ncbi:hypothetical protein HYPBUDRAFT_11759 [Hyphopichia burtonii NRRL Y-1933]|uniref:Uncharacterized protein n=1 Tax=Hyphopichia burtonii NRRL Y-1933 TaxID=984485 RepID=A0A1E4RIT6_9ASCO|nr:hypothetical protein HYPBUDRAFT_11759 [Hyphopichia burtonii NRRL Y-1933]ODV67163.1 hypothetical protein HYPBUDRAFT_11759 [Hyphopichia burtonii NRRL Y-1933]